MLLDRAGFIASAASFVLAQNKPLAVGVVPAETYAEANFANQVGIFAQNGLAVDVTVLANAGGVAAAVASGALDIGIGSVGQIAAARENGIPLSLIAPGALYNAKAPTGELRVATWSKIEKASDLNGKNIGIDNLRGLPQISIDVWIRKNGGDTSTIKYIELPFPAMAAALQAGRIDAAVIAEPALTAARDTTRFFADTLSAIAGSFLISVWYAANPWLTANLAVAHRFAAAIDQTARWANSHHVESAPIVEALTKVAPDIAVRMRRAYFGTQLEPRLIDPLLVLAQQYGVTKTVLDGRSMIYPGF